MPHVLSLPMHTHLRNHAALGAPAPVLTTAPQAGPALGCFDSCPPHNPLDGTPIVGEALPTPPSREDPGGSPGQQGPDLPGYRRQRGLYFPVNQVRRGRFRGPPGSVCGRPLLLVDEGRWLVEGAACDG